MINQLRSLNIFSSKCGVTQLKLDQLLPIYFSNHMLHMQERDEHFFLSFSFFKKKEKKIFQFDLSSITAGNLQDAKITCDSKWRAEKLMQRIFCLSNMQWTPTDGIDYGPNVHSWLCCQWDGKLAVGYKPQKKKL